jgi:hypothetical protein
MDLNKTDSTRYLCAAAYLDKNFRELVIQEILKEEYNAIAKCYGVDLAMVVKHCLLARKQERKLDILLLITFCLFYFVKVKVAANNNYYQYLSACFILVTIGIVFLNKWDTRYRLLAQQLSKSNITHSIAKFNFGKILEARLEKLAQEQNGNVIVYGGFSPFVGSGYDIGGWSFSLNISNGREKIGKTQQLIPFEVEELYEHVVNSIRDLDLYGLAIEDKLCVNGQEIRSNTLFLPNPFSHPSYQVDSSVIKKFVNTDTKHIRGYKHIKVITWNGELVFSVFLRFRKFHKNLFIETSYFWLPPVNDNYKEIDKIVPGITFTKIRRVLLDSMLEVIFSRLFILFVFNTDKLSLDKLLFTFSLEWYDLTFVLLPIVWKTRIIEAWLDKRRRKKSERIIKETANFNYGAITSLREIASSSEFSQYFQSLDQEMYFKVIEGAIIDNLSDFLESKNIDTSDLKERQMAIFNSGIIVSGGNIKAKTLSVGEKSKAVISNVVKPLRKYNKKRVK